MAQDNMNLYYQEKLSIFTGVRYPMPSSYTRWSGYQKFGWNFYIFFAQFVCFMQVWTQFVKISVSLDDLGTICNCITAISFLTHLQLKFFILYKNRLLFKKLYSDVKAMSAELCANPLLDNSFKRMYDDHYNRIKIFATVKGATEVTLTFILIMGFVVYSIVESLPKATPGLSWAPYDIKHNPGFSIACLMEFLAFGSSAARNAAIDFLFWSMLAVPTLQLRYLKLLMGLIFKKIEGSHNLKKNFLLTKPKHEFRYTNDVEKEQYLLVIWWIKMHQRIIRHLEEFQSVASTFLAVSYLLTLINLMTSGIVAITSSWTLPQKIVINGMIFSNAMQLYIVSFNGDNLREAGESLLDSGSLSAIFSANPFLRKCYLFILQRVKKPIIFRFAGINPLSSFTFGKLIRKTLTYFVTIVQLKQEHADIVV